MRVLVTGCGGYLGSEIVRQLLRRGDTVIGVSRGEYPDLVDQGMQHTRGDLIDGEFTSRTIRGVDSVVHTAAVAGVWGPWKHFYRTNTVATENVVAACQSAGIHSLVFTSSPSVTFDGGNQSGIDETAPYARRWMCHYPHSKALAERAVLAAHRSDGLHTVALRPHLIWGENDPHILPRLIERARAGKLRIIGRSTNLIDNVHVTNAAAAHLDAIDTLHADSSRARPAGGRAYFISQGTPVNCWDWIARLCRIAGVAPPTKRIGYAAAYAVGASLEAMYRVSGRRTEPPMTRFVAAQMARDHYFDISAARKRLGYHVRVSTSDGLAELSRCWATDPT